MASDAEHQGDKNLKTLEIAGHLIVDISNFLYFGFKKVPLYRVLIKNWYCHILFHIVNEYSPS